MVKKFIKDNDDVEDEELSDLEIDNEEISKDKEFINDTEELEKFATKIKEEFLKSMKNKANWLETLDVTSEDLINPNLNTDDDIKRELIFYNISHKTAIKAINLLKLHKEKINRPEDFFAEMIKSDEQMNRIKKNIIGEQQRIKKFEEKKQKNQNIKFSKALKDNQAKQKTEYKRKTKEGVDNWKKRKKYFLKF